MYDNYNHTHLIREIFQDETQTKQYLETVELLPYAQIDQSALIEMFTRNVYY